MIASLTLATGATVSVTGGTTQTFGPTGDVVAGGVQVADVNASSFITQTKVRCTSRMPKATVGPNGTTYNKMKCSATLIIPTVDSQGVTQNNLVRVELEVHPETLAAVRTELLNKAAQLVVDSDMGNFWSVGALN